MKRKFLRSMSAFALATAMSLGAFALAACKFDDDDGKKPSEPLTDSPLTGDTLADWSEGKADTVFESDGWSNGSVFNTQWSANNVSYENGTMKLTISENPNGSEETNNEYYGGEGRTYQWFGYGDYEVCMKPAKKAGTASTFFTCTGDYDINPDTDLPNPWDEIDIEFLGQDTTKVQFNYYVNGQGGHEYMYDLGFDASEEFHEYGFRWTSEYIVWFVDDEPVYKVEASEDNPLPSTAGRILMNYWTGTEEAEGWMGEYSNPGTEGAEYKWVKTSAEAAWGEIPEPVEVEEFEGDWSEIDSVTPTYEASNNSGAAQPLYTVTAGENGAATVTYTSAGAYDNVKFNAAELGAEKNWLHFVIKNNGENTSNVRINVRSASAAINSYGFGNGELLRTSLGEGTFLDIAAGETVEVEIYFAGVVESVEFMMDSLQSGVIEKSGNLTISDVKFARQGELEIPEESVNNGITVNGTNVKFTGGTYIVNTDDETNSMNVTYENVSGKSYMNLSGDVSVVSKDKGEVTFKVANNGEESVKLRIDLLAGGANSATGVSVEGDSEASFTASDSATVTVAAGVTETITVTFAGAVQSMAIFIDSSTWNDETTHSGDVTFSEMAFGGEAEEPAPSNSITINDTAVTPEAATGFTATADSENNTLGIVYTDVKGNAYSGITLAGLSTVAAANNTFTVKLTNNGETAINLRLDVMANTSVGENNNNKCNVSATMDGTEVYTDLEWGGSMFDGIAPGATVTLVVKYDNARQPLSLMFMFDTHKGDENLHSGDVTLSDMAFSNDSSEPVTPPEGGSSVDMSKVTIGGNLVANGGPYTATAGENNTLGVTYSAVKGNSYQNVNLTGLEAAATANNVFTLKVTNNGDQTLNLRIDIFSSEQVSANTQACNISATQDGVAVRTDTDWGGSFFTIEAGQTVTIQIVYDNTKAQQSIQFMLDSHMGTDTTHSGNVIFSEMAFATV